MVNCGDCEDEQNSQGSFDESYKCLLTDPYQDTVWNASQQIGHGPNLDSSEIFNLSWINEGCQAAGTGEPLTAQGFFQTASGMLPLENQIAAGIQTLTHPLWGQPADISTHLRNNICGTTEAKQKWRERKRRYDREYRERMKQKRQKLEVENLEKDEQMKAFKAEIGRLNGHEQLMKTNLAELKAENESLTTKLKYSEQLVMMLKKGLKRLAKEMEDMLRAQTVAMETAVEEEKNELRSLRKQSDQFLISEMLMRVKAEYGFLDALFTEIPNNELFGTQAIPHEVGFESTNLIRDIWDS